MTSVSTLLLALCANADLIAPVAVSTATMSTAADVPTVVKEPPR